MELTAIAVGVAIAKTILKECMDEELIVEEGFTGLIDRAGSSISDTSREKKLLRKRTKREIEDITEAISYFIEQKAYNYDLPDESKQKVINCLVHTVEKFSVSTKIILDLQIDSKKVFESLLNIENQYTFEFYGNEKIFYEYLLKETADVIIETSASLSGFTPQSFAAILAQGNSIIDKINKAITSLENLEKNLDTTASDSFNDLEKNYLKTVWRLYNRQKLFGVQFDNQAQHKAYDLNVSYINLNVSKGEFDEESESVEQALSRGSRILITGLAGSGKTTLLHWLAIKSSKRDFVDSLIEMNSKIPFLVKLREVDLSSGIPELSVLATATCPAIESEQISPWVKSVLSSGRALVMIDGIDEVYSESRVSVDNWVENLISTYPDSTFLITSRPSAVDNGCSFLSTLMKLHLKDMEISEIECFVEHWFKAISILYNSQEDIVKLNQQQSDFLELMKATPKLRELASTPLLCGMLCALYRERESILPTNKVTLYDSFVRMFLHNRDEERRVKISPAHPVDFDQKEALLRHLAVWMMRNNKLQPSRDKVIIQFNLGNKQLTKPLNLKPNELLKFFLERSGLLREPAIGYIDFVHKTFLEFLASKEFVDLDSIDELIKYSSDDSWYETIQLAAGSCNQKQFEELVTGLFDKGESEPKNKHALHLLAISCLDYRKSNLSIAVRKRAEKNLKGLIPPKNITEAKSLSSVGDIAVKYLGGKTLKANQTAATIRALAMISSEGNELAAKKLSLYASDKRQTVFEEAVKIVDFMPKDLFEKHISDKISFKICYLTRKNFIYAINTNKISPIKYLNIEGIGNYFKLDLTEFKQLKTLKILYSATINSSVLTLPTNIKKLEIAGYRSSLDIDVFSAIDAAEVKGIKLSGMFSISNKNNIENNCVSDLYINAREDFDISMFKSLINLTVRFGYNNEKLSNILTCSSLKTLSITGLYDWDDSLFLRLKNIEKIKVSTLIKNIPDISKFENLTQLNIAYYRGDIKLIEKLKDVCKKRNVKLFLGKNQLV